MDSFGITCFFGGRRKELQNPRGRSLREGLGVGRARHISKPTWDTEGLLGISMRTSVEQPINREK